MFRLPGNYRFHNVKLKPGVRRSRLFQTPEVAVNSFVRFILGLFLLVVGGLIALKIIGFLLSMAVGALLYFVIIALAIIGILGILGGALYLMVPGGGESDVKAATKASKKARADAALASGDDKPSADAVAAELRRQRDELRRAGRE